MSSSTSILGDLLQILPGLRSQIFFKSSLIALSHAMEDRALAESEPPLIVANFKRERFYRQESHRYQRLARQTSQVYVLAAPETDFAHRSGAYECVALDPEDELAKEWHLIVLGREHSVCLVCRERLQAGDLDPEEPNATSSFDTDPVRTFEGLWTFDRRVCIVVARLLLERVLSYRPELQTKIEAARKEYGIPAKGTRRGRKANAQISLDAGDPFSQRLVTYLQAGQYKLLKAYNAIAAQEQKQRSVNSITSAIRQSMHSDEILQIAVRELGQTLQASRCLMYRCQATDATARVEYEYLNDDRATSLAGETWILEGNPLFREAIATRKAARADDAPTDERFLAPEAEATLAIAERHQIRTWLVVPVFNRGQLLAIVELHDSNDAGARNPWKATEMDLVEAIAIQVGIALIQAEAYANLEDFNQQLEALENTRSNLIAITGHELRTPLSTIQVCLESLASEPDMPQELQQVMLDSALADAERLRELVQDFLTLSRLESGRVEWNLEPLALRECVDLALSSTRARSLEADLPQIDVRVPVRLPLVRADGEWLVEVLAKLLDNACKFTQAEGTVTIAAQIDKREIELTIADTGRGIEPDRLEAIFDRFYQEEGALRRTTGGTGLGLTICRQIVRRLGGKIWAESDGKDKGSRFHFTVPIVEAERQKRPQANAASKKTTTGKRSSPKH